MLASSTNTHTHTHTHARACAHARMHARTHPPALPFACTRARAAFKALDFQQSGTPNWEQECEIQFGSVLFTKVSTEHYGPRMLLRCRCWTVLVVTLTFTL